MNGCMAAALGGERWVCPWLAADGWGVVCQWVWCVSGFQEGEKMGPRDSSTPTEPVSTDTKPNPNLAQCTNGS